MGDGAAEEPSLLDLDPSDPDAIAAKPPAKAIDAKTYFQVGQHEGKWSEYDDRGVPVKNMKKKKPTKKEKEVLETEYLDASKAYQKYLKDVENWEQAKLDSEKELKKTDRLRWSFRQVGQKHDPIDPDEMETIMKLMGWKPLAKNEFKVVRKGLQEVANAKGQIELEALRDYVKNVMPVALSEERLMSEQLDSIDLEDIYSPRTWRRKLEENPPPKKSKSSPRSSSARKSMRKTTKAEDGKTSPRRNSGASPRGPAKGDGSSSARGKAGGGASPRRSSRRA